jgi:hypothetical protein
MAQIISDDFNRANAADLGANWTVAGSWHTNTNRAVVDDFSGTNVAKFTGAAWTGGADQYAEATVAVALPSSPDDVGVVARYGTGLNFYEAVTDSAGGLLLNKVVAGGTTLLGLGGTTVAVGGVLRCEAQGTTIRSRLDGVLQTTVTDAAHSTGNPGMHGDQASAAVALDSFAAGDLASALITNYKPAIAQRMT